jgi:hypothetical protein
VAGENLLGPQYQTLPTQAGQVTQLPPGVQYGIDQSMLQRALAQAMLQRGMQTPEGQTIVTGAGAPNRYVRPNIMQNLAQVANTAAGVRMLGGANKSLADIMREYQGQVNAAQQGAAGTLGGGAAQPTPQGQAPAVGSGMTSTQALASYQQMKSSGIPAVMAEADKLLPLIGELRKNEASIAAENARTAFGAGAAVAQPQGLVAGANASGIGGGGLQAPGAPQTSMVNGVLTAQEPHTGKIQAVAENPLSTAMTKKVQDTQMSIIGKRVEDAEKAQQDAIGAGNLAATGRALREIIPKAALGPQAMERAELQRWSGLLGFTLPESTTYTQLAHQLALGFLGAAKATSGFQGRLSTQEASWLREASGQNLDITNPALMTMAHNAEMYGLTSVANHNRKMQQFGAHAAANKVPGAFDGLSVTPEMISPISTGEEFMPKPAITPEAKPGAIDLRGQIK